MDQNFDFTSYNNIKRLSEEELTALWEKYFEDKTKKMCEIRLLCNIYILSAM